MQDTENPIEAQANDLTAKRLAVVLTGDRESLKLTLTHRVRAEALRNAGECLSAIFRHVPTDMLSAWRRFADCMGQTFDANLGPDPRVESIWQLPSLIALVMGNVDSPDANRHWLDCEKAMRAYAEHRAIYLRTFLDTDQRVSHLDEDDDERLAIEGEITALLRFVYPAQAEVSNAKS